MIGIRMHVSSSKRMRGGVWLWTATGFAITILFRLLCVDDSARPTCRRRRWENYDGRRGGLRKC